MGMEIQLLVSFFPCLYGNLHSLGSLHLNLITVHIRNSCHIVSLLYHPTSIFKEGEHKSLLLTSFTFILIRYLQFSQN